ncbi:DASS family sodium-coupled anion symporter [Lipingzhangella sp. LS1_29]|uniref:Sodium-dependent dicarboxylate transporter SdcS n=1 Tax=Lipingzhangella rawalii TaxID=2055835 RepID=A0ABU2H1T3_9ACTN|nr:DASS family sodium-coupled anion symporter [Lipingzhangella rawalii]MDS1269251.1 DASS family sodium-coupled anion symporter [Lipingzhangella rawalii]
MSSTTESTTDTGAREDDHSSAEDTNSTLRKRIGLVLGIVAAIALYILMPDIVPPVPDGAAGQVRADELEALGLSPEAPAHLARATAAVAALMAVWWMTEAIPLPATALLPLVLFPVLGVTDIGGAASPYASHLIFLFMGGFMLALAMQRWNLHRRIALTIVSWVGFSPTMLIAGFMLATAFITMWVSNTATTIMMLPIGISVLALVAQNRGGHTDSNFATALLLGIAYASSIGSVSTLIGTPPNVFMAGYLAENHDIHVSFGQWMLIGVPLAAVFLVVCWFVLTRVVFPPKISELEGGRELIRDQLREMGPMSRGERIVLVVFALAALAWILNSTLQSIDAVLAAAPWLESVSDAGIAITVAIVLFLIPVDGRRGTPVLDWTTAAQLPWGILLLFGGGLSLSAQFEASGLSSWIGERVEGLAGVPGWVLVLVVAGIVLLLTELTSNTATANIFIPIMAAVAIGMHLDVMALVIPAALAASLAFMLPVATPPNAIVFGTGHIKVGQMVKAGVWLNIIALLLVLGVMYTLASWVYGV